MNFSTQLMASSTSSTALGLAANPQKEMQKLSREIQICEQALERIDQQLTQRVSLTKKADLLTQQDQINEKMWNYQKRWLILRQAFRPAVDPAKVKKAIDVFLAGQAAKTTQVTIPDPIDEPLDCLRQEIEPKLLEIKHQIAKWNVKLLGLREIATKKPSALASRGQSVQTPNSQSVPRKNQGVIRWYDPRKYGIWKILFIIIASVGSAIALYKNQSRILSYARDLCHVFASYLGASTSTEPVLLTSSPFSSVSSPSSSSPTPSSPSTEQLRAAYSALHQEIRYYIKDRGHSLAWCLRHGPKISQDLYNWIIANGKMKKHW